MTDEEKVSDKTAEVLCAINGHEPRWVVRDNLYTGGLCWACRKCEKQLPRPDHDLSARAVVDHYPKRAWTSGV